MGFDYDKMKQKQAGGEESGSMWTSYSDLFMVLCVVFLLLYVVASLRSGTAGIQRQIELKKMTAEAADLKQQIQVYNTLKKEYLEKEASKDEEDTYNELMDKLNLLQDEQRKEASDLRRQAKENEKKELALNKYQQMIRNIINANMLSKAKIKKRDELIKENEQIIKVKEEEIKDNLTTIADQDEQIETQERTIEEKQKDLAKKQQMLEENQEQIADLETEMAAKKKVILENQKRISSLNSNLDNKISELTKAQKLHKTSKEKLQKDIEKIREATEQKISDLKSQNQNANAQLAQASSELKEASKLIEQQEREKAKLDQELAQVGQELEQTRDQYQEQMEQLRAQHERKVAAERAAFDQEVKKQKLTGELLKKRMAQFNKEAQAKESAMNRQMADLAGKFQETSKALNQAETEKGRALASVQELSNKNKQIEEDLERLRRIEAAKRAVAENIRNNLAKAGIKGGVDGKSGDVTISFEREFFESGKADLKEAMKETLNKFMPKYSEGLFQDPETAKKISSIEIIGFSSPTYKGKFVDPNSNSAEDRKAMEYNLDLSIKRAKSIFSYVSDQAKLRYKHQDRLRPLVKVTGRGFFENGKIPPDVKPGMKEKEFCKKFDCNQAQKVIIKFNIEE